MCIFPIPPCTIHYVLCTMPFPPTFLLSTMLFCFVLQTLHYALCALYYSVFTMHDEIYTMQYAICTLPYALCALRLHYTILEPTHVLHFLRLHGFVGHLGVAYLLQSSSLRWLFVFNTSMECKLYSRLQYKSHVRIGFDLSIGNMNQEWEPDFFAI